MKALVTGSNGFIGSFLVARLLQQGHEVRCLVRKTSNLRWLQGLDVEYVYGELTQPETLPQVVQNVEVIFHLAGVTKAKDRAGYLDGNLNATMNLLHAAEQYGAPTQKMIFVSSQAAGGPSAANEPVTEATAPHPISLYGEAKLMAEKAVLEFAQKRFATIIRPPSVYGPRDKDVLVLFQNVQRGFLPVLGSGTQKASLVHVDDLVDGILLAARSEQARGKIYYISGDEALNWVEIGRLLARAMSKKVFILHVPAVLLDPISWLSVRFARLSGKPALLNPDKVREMKQAGWLCSNAKAKAELGFQPQVDLLQGFKQTAEWYRANHWL